MKSDFSVFYRNDHIPFFPSNHRGQGSIQTRVVISIFNHLRLFIRWTAAWLVLAYGHASASPGEIDTSLLVGAGTSGSIRAVVVDSQSRLLVAGGFTTFNNTSAGRLIRLLGNGSVDPDFNIGTGANSEITSIEILPDGRILLGGAFTSFNTTTTRGLVLLDSTGAVDPTFTSRFTSTGFSAGVACLKSLPGGNLIVGGYFTQYDGVPVGRYAILTSSGALVNQALQNPGADSHVLDIDLLNDGGMLLCGFFRGINGHETGCVARLLPGGSVDSGFSTGSQIGTVAYSVAGQPDGKVLIGGSFSTFFGLGKHYLGRLTSTGSLDTSFEGTSGPNLNVYGVTLDSKGRILIAGQFSRFHDQSMTGIGRLQPDGSRDRSFTFTPTVSSSFIQEYPIDPEGRIIAYGWSNVFSVGAPANLLRLTGGDSLPHDEWRILHFGAATGTGDAAWDATPGRDGITNLEKYGLGFQDDPRTPVTLWNDDGLLHGFWRDDHSSGFRYQTDISRTDVAAVPVWSPSLGSWLLEGLELIEESRTGTLVTWKVTLPGSHPGAFFRVRISLND